MLNWCAIQPKLKASGKIYNKLQNAEFFMLSQKYQIVVYLLKGTNGRQKTYEVFHVYCIFYSGFMCQTTVIFEITKDGSLESNNLAI